MTGSWHEGYEAYPAKNLVDNPYPRESKPALDWEEGWKARWFEELQEERKRS